jgi:Flp pilus assembly protein TadG
MDKMRRWARDQRGSILLFTTVLVVPLMIIIGGLAMDLAYYGTVDDELQRSMDAAALAGAGKLGFNETYFAAARQWAHDYASLNPYRVGSIDLTPGDPTFNEANVETGGIVLGKWNGTTFQPMTVGSEVNAVQCRFSTTVPTSFLRLIGINSLNAGAMAIAWAAQPGTTPPNACVFPIALSSCFFQGTTSLGCGATIRLISSSPGSAVEGNTAGWINLAPNATDVHAGDASDPTSVRGQIALAASGNCNGTALNTGNEIPSTNGDLNSAINDLMTIFPQKYATSPDNLTVLKQDGTPAYIGHGWEVFVPVIDTGSTCPPTVINGALPIVGWTRMVITQVYNSGASCAVANHWEGNEWDQHCLVSKNGTVPSMSDLPQGWSGQKGIFGYNDCQYSPAPPAPNPGPITATAKLKLVK